MYLCTASVIASTNMIPILIFFLNSQSPGDYLTRDKNLEASSSDGVKSPTSRVLTSLAIFFKRLLPFQPSLLFYRKSLLWLGDCFSIAPIKFLLFPPAALCKHPEFFGHGHCFNFQFFCLKCLYYSLAPFLSLVSSIGRFKFCLFARSLGLIVVLSVVFAVVSSIATGFSTELCLFWMHHESINWRNQSVDKISWE